MLMCKEVARKVASGENEEGSIRQRLAIRVHLLMCRYCRLYVAQMRALGVAARKAWTRTEEERGYNERLEESILRRARTISVDKDDPL